MHRRDGAANLLGRMLSLKKYVIIHGLLSTEPQPSGVEMVLLLLAVSRLLLAILREQLLAVVEEEVLPQLVAPEVLLGEVTLEAGSACLQAPNGLLV